MLLPGGEALHSCPQGGGYGIVCEEGFAKSSRAKEGTQKPAVGFSMSP